jgi:hypothetical protein
LGTKDDQVLYLYKIFLEGITTIVPWVKKQNRKAPCPCTIHAIFVINLSFLPRIPWESFRAQTYLYESILDHFLFPGGFFSIFEITTNFGVYGVHSTHVPKNHVQQVSHYSSKKMQELIISHSNLVSLPFPLNDYNIWQGTLSNIVLKPSNLLVVLVKQRKKSHKF